MQPIINVVNVVPTIMPAMNAAQQTHASVRFAFSSLSVATLLCRWLLASFSRSFSVAYSTQRRSRLSQLLSMMSVGGLPSVFCFTLAFTFARPLAAV